MVNEKISKKKSQSIRTRATILEAATQCFGDNGYLGCSLDTIAQAAGITKGAIYTHFSSKAELFIAIIEHAYKQAIDMALLLKNNLTFADATIELLRQCMSNPNFPIDHKLWAEIISVSGRDAQVREIFLRCQAEFQMIIENWMKMGIEAGEINPGVDIKSVSEMLLVIGNGLITHLTADQNYNFNADFRIFENTVRNIIKA